MSEIVVQFSGGTDSTAAVSLLTGRYERIHLLTFKHSGLHHIENSRYNVPKLKEVFPNTEFTHRIYNIDRLFKTVTYFHYSHFLFKYGFLNLTTCGLCKLAMHIRTLLYCCDLGIKEAADGANSNSYYFPAQMKEVVELISEMYDQFGIRYTTPVFDYDFPDDIDWEHKLGLPALADKKKKRSDRNKRKTTGELLFEKGILTEENVKGTETDRNMQARCFQLTLLNAVALGYFIPKHGMEKYRNKVKEFYGEKIFFFTRELGKHIKGGGSSILFYALREKRHGT